MTMVTNSLGSRGQAAAAAIEAILTVIEVEAVAFLENSDARRPKDFAADVVRALVNQYGKDVLLP